MCVCVFTLHHSLTDCPAGTYGENCNRTCFCGQGVDHCDIIKGCVCQTGWSGVNCDFDVNECDLKAVREECQAKNAVCFNFEGGYSCRCQQGYAKDDNGTCRGKVPLKSSFACVDLPASSVFHFLLLACVRVWGSVCLTFFLHFLKHSFSFFSHKNTFPSFLPRREAGDV